MLAVATVQDRSLMSKEAERTCARYKLTQERVAVTHQFCISGHEGYITVGLYDDGAPGEVFITMSKGGSTIRGLLDSIGILTSLLLQHGVELERIADKFRYARFEPLGYTSGCADITTATSVLDYVFHWLVLRFSDENDWPAEPTIGEREDADEG